MNKLIRTAVVSAAVLTGSLTALSAAPASAATAPVSVSPSVDCSRSKSINPRVTVGVNSPIAGPINQWVATRAVFFRWSGAAWTNTGASNWDVRQGGTTVDFGSFDASPGYYYLGFQTYSWSGSAWVDGKTTWATTYHVWAPGSGTQSSFCEVRNLSQSPF